MGWLDRLFPGSKKSHEQIGVVTSAPAGKVATPSAPAASSGGESIPDYKVGLDGNFDESGLAKRVALAFDNDPQLDDVGTLWVAQLSSKVVLRGKVPSQDYLNKAVAIAKQVDGATEVDTSEVTIG